MPKPLSKQKATALLEQAKLHLSLGQDAKAEELLREVAHHTELKSSLLFVILAEAQANQERLDDAEATLEEGLRRFPADADLEARLANLLVRRDRVDEGLAKFERVKGRLARDPAFLTQHAYALIRAGRLDEAESRLTSAASAGGGLEARLVMAIARGKRGRYAEAEEIASRVEEAGKNPRLTAAAKAVRADCRLFLGDAAGALSLWEELRETRQLEDGQLGHMAYAAQLAGRPELADELIALRKERGPTAEDLLLFAQISNLRGEPDEALALLAASDSAPGERHPGHAFEVLATQGRALRLAGRAAEARAVLAEAAALPEFANARLGPKVHVDLGHLAAEEGDFDQAADRFRAALALDGADPEARRAMALTERRVAWKSELEASTEAKVEAARAEAEALRHRFVTREGELEALRQELDRAKAAQREAEQRARSAAEEARRAADEARAAHDRKVREELEQREREAEEKAAENVERALGPHIGRCPPALENLLLVAEQTFQKALYTELPAAAVAVLYSGALERALFMFFVERFDRWLDEGGRREPFLTGAVRERRGKRVEYFDHFVEAFDHDRAGKAPSMGEVGRVLARRKEPYLEPFLKFLRGSYAVSDGYYDELAAFVMWSKEKLRDPTAHGRGIELGYDELRRFREQLMFQLGSHAQGALAALLAPPG